MICDRFTDSTYAYQGAGRGLPRETIRRIEAVAVPDIKPDLTFILDLPAADRPCARTALRKHDETRFERFDLAFHERLRECFRTIARKPRRSLRRHRCGARCGRGVCRNPLHGGAALWCVSAHPYLARQENP